MDDPTRQIANVTIEAVVTRLNGTVENLGVIASSEDGNVLLEQSEKED